MQAAAQKTAKWRWSGARLWVPAGGGDDDQSSGIAATSCPHRLNEMHPHYVADPDRGQMVQAHRHVPSAPRVVDGMPAPKLKSHHGLRTVRTRDQPFRTQLPDGIEAGERPEGRQIFRNQRAGPRSFILRDGGAARYPEEYERKQESAHLYLPS